MALGKARQPWGPCPTLGLDSRGTLHPHQGPGASCPSGLGPPGLGRRAAPGTTTPQSAHPAHPGQLGHRLRGQCYLPRPPRARITHKASRALQPDSYPFPRQVNRGWEMSTHPLPRPGPQPPQGPLSAGRPCGLSPSPTVSLAAGPGVGGAASALVSIAVSITHLGAHGALSLPAGRRPQSPGGGVSSAQAS